ncbi:MAG: hypothetical protein LC798_05305 [Chloroflexi bacterium]|nr:hypothetical protein [Chloroflexota bacterium]
MIGALGLGLVGTGLVFIWAGWKDRKVGDFFAELRGGAKPDPRAPDPFLRGDFAPEPGAPLGRGADGKPIQGPVLPSAGVPR